MVDFVGYLGFGADVCTAYEDLICNAVAAELNSGGKEWSATFATEGTVAVRTLAPWYTPAALATLKCSVVPLTIERRRLSRSMRELDYEVGIDLQRTVTTNPLDDMMLRSLNCVAQEIHDYFDDAHELPGFEDWICLQADREDVYDGGLLYAEKIWETLITVTVRGRRGT